MSRTRKDWSRFGPRTGSVRRGVRPRDRRSSLPALVEDEYGWQRGLPQPERGLVPRAASGENRAAPQGDVRSISLTGDDDT